MGNEFVQDGVPDPTFKVGEDSVGNTSFSGVRELKAEASEVGLVEGRSELEDTVRDPRLSLLTDLPRRGSGQEGSEDLVVFNGEGDGVRGVDLEPPTRAGEDIVEGAPDHEFRDGVR